MKVELPYFKIGDSVGGQQAWSHDYMMKIGGCGAISACDCSIYLELYKNLRGLYPFDVKNISKEDYIKFSEVIKPYLHPRWHGIDKLEIYIDGFTKFLRDHGENNLQLLDWDGHKDFKSTHMVLKYGNSTFKFYCLQFFLHYTTPKKNFTVPKNLTYIKRDIINYK